MSDTQMIDLLVVGGGINGAGIARDAAGRGLSVVLCEKDDLAQGTSSRSGKLVHGGLRYLEYYEFRLVREALADAGVVASAPTVEDADTGTCVVLVDNEAERTFITTQGVEAEPHAEAFALLGARHLAPRRWAPRVKAPAVFRYALALRARGVICDRTRMPKPLFFGSRAAGPPISRQSRCT